MTRSVDPSDTVAGTITGEIQLGRISRKGIYRLLYAHGPARLDVFFLGQDRAARVSC